ncbi:MAG: polysaccharide export outer membrane [Geobacteraceae bacterium]|nr:MAG: polysaccharide export outer membrane [Geobacteraceae bacterium]
MFSSVLLAAVPLQAATDGDYVIGDGDGLQISVWDTPQLSTGATVRPDGKITLPGVGDVVASGFSPAQLSEKLTEKLAKFVKKPIVTVIVGGITNNKIYVFGGGVPPGVINLPGRTTLLKFLIRFGSFKGIDLEHSYLLREGKKLSVNFYDLLIKGDLSKDVMLQAEDILYLPDNEANKIYLMGAINTPKYIFYRQGVKILDAILEAGGFTKFAKENSVLILRKGPNEREEITVKIKDLMKDGDISQNIDLMPGDFVIVKESIF